MEVKYIHGEDIHNKSSAGVILPIVLDLINPKTVLDVGCGIGTWLSVAKELGINVVKGVDGAYVDRELLSKYLFEEEFASHDLTQALDLGIKYDLCICLEVAEHLPESGADTLIKSLISHSDVTLFSAAIPGQGGQNHLNEQWPDYWANKFENHGFVFLDCIRSMVWDNSQVDYWYRQNIFLVVKESHDLAQKYSKSNLSLIHPELYQTKNEYYQRKIYTLQNQLAVHPLKRWIKNLISKS